MKNRLFLFLLLLTLIFTFLGSPLTARELPLKRVTLTNTGNNKIVPAITYLKNIVKQAQGKITFTAEAINELKDVETGNYYMKGQSIGDLINNFCNLYMTVSYRFNENLVEIYALKKVSVKTKRFLDYGFKKNNIMIGFGWGANFRTFSPISEGDMYPLVELPIRSISMEWMFSDYFGIEGSFSYFKSEVPTDEYIEIYFFNLMLNYHFSIWKFDFFAGVGLSGYKFKTDGTSQNFADERGTQEINFAPTAALGVYVRIFRKIILGARFVVADVGISAVTGGIYIKL